jgi:hypothetical protein
MSLTLPNLYCSPQDVFDQAGIAGAQLRLDDGNLATGQVIELTAAANQGDTSLVIESLTYPVLTGTHLVFAEAGVPTPVEVTVSAPAAVGLISLPVAPLGASLPAGAQATDNGVNVWLAGLMLKACRYATGQVKSYCCPRYEDSDLANNASENGDVNRWATAIATRWLAKRRFQVAPAGIEQDFQEALQELKAVRTEGYNIADIATRTSGWPFLSNVSSVDWYTIRKIRVEQQISEGTPTQYAQAVDWNSIFLFEY